LAPIWSRLAEIYNNRNLDFKIASMTCDGKGKSICRKYEIKKFPYLAWFKNGEKFEEFFGPQTLEELKGYVEFHVPKNTEL
jgi:thioredoxin-like negative regulator of GroEL